MQDDNPNWILPESCFKTRALTNLEEAEVGEWKTACQKYQQSGNCSDITKDQPRYKCSYKSLSSFYQMQQHIRNHGAVVTR
jgi:uncharacterized membrane protein YfbV (UPF0208 family)